MSSFNEFMNIWVPSVGIEEAFKAWCQKEEQQEAAYIVPDIEPFMDTSGTLITGRSAWKDHLRKTGSEEFGHQDLKKLTEAQLRKRAEYREKMSRLAAQAKVTHEPAPPIKPSDTVRRVMARLHDRPMPDRKTLIQIAMEERKRK